ncbi:hypothetical protein BDR22DRAFT_892686 [Usnea florida]
MGRLHVQLSDNTTVIYNANDGVDQLWKMGAACERRDRSSVPVFQIWGDYGLDKRVTYNRSPAFGAVPGRPVEVECSLVFLPGKSWFGPGGPRSMYKNKEMIGSMKNPTKDEHKDGNNDWRMETQTSNNLSAKWGKTTSDGMFWTLDVNGQRLIIQAFPNKGCVTGAKRVYCPWTGVDYFEETTMGSPCTNADDDEFSVLPLRFGMEMMETAMKRGMARSQ